jgi:hypothetical protein
MTALALLLEQAGGHDGKVTIAVVDAIPGFGEQILPSLVREKWQLRRLEAQAGQPHPGCFWTAPRCQMVQNKRH